LAKTAKRSRDLPVRSPAQPKASRVPASATRARATTSELVEGEILSVSADGRVRAVLSRRATIEALCPAHIDGRWLAEASRRAPVPAVFATARPSGRYVLFAVFPGDAHADVKVDVVILGRDVRVEAESISLNARDAHVRLDVDGNVSMRGRDLTSHARRVNRIKGGAIRLN
jgi:hypothetical protein